MRRHVLKTQVEIVKWRKLLRCQMTSNYEVKQWGAAGVRKSLQFGQDGTKTPSCVSEWGSASVGERLTRALVRFLRFGTSSSISSASSSWGKSPTSSFYGRDYCMLLLIVVMFGCLTPEDSCPCSFFFLKKKLGYISEIRLPIRWREHPPLKYVVLNQFLPLNHFPPSLLQPCAAWIHCSVKWLLYITAGHNRTKVCIPLPSETFQRLINSKFYCKVIYGAFMVSCNVCAPYIGYWMDGWINGWVMDGR